MLPPVYSKVFFAGQVDGGESATYSPPAGFGWIITQVIWTPALDDPVPGFGLYDTGAAVVVVASRQAGIILSSFIFEGRIVLSPPIYDPTGFQVYNYGTSGGNAYVGGYELSLP